MWIAEDFIMAEPVDDVSWGAIFVQNLNENMQPEGIEFCDYFWDFLLGKDMERLGYTSERARELETEFNNSCPVDKQAYIEMLHSQLTKSDYPVDVELKHLKYLTTLIFHWTDLPKSQHQTLLLWLARFFFLLVVKTPNDIIDTHRAFKIIFQKIGVMLYGNVLKNSDMSKELSLELKNCLLQAKIHPEDFNCYILALTSTVLAQNRIIYKSFKSLSDVEFEADHIFYAFQCLDAMTRNAYLDANGTQHVYSNIICLLLKPYEGHVAPVLQVNLRNFLSLIIERVQRKEWLIQSFILTAKRYGHNMEFIEFLNGMPIAFYEALGYKISKEFRNNCSEHDRIIYQLLLYPHPLLTAKKRALFVKCYFKSLFHMMRSDIKAKVLFSLEKFAIFMENETMAVFFYNVYNAADNSEDEPGNKEFHAINKLLLTKIDKTWKDKEINSLYLKVMWTLYAQETRMFSKQSLLELEELTELGSASDIKDCVTPIKNVIMQSHDNDQALCKYLLHILVRHSCSPTPTGNYYALEIFDLTIGNIVGNKPRNAVAYDLLTWLSTPTFDYSYIFKKMVSQNLIKDDVMQYLFNQCIFVKDKAWPITLLIMQLKKYNREIPRKVLEFLNQDTKIVLAYDELHHVLNLVEFVLQANRTQLDQDNLKQSITNIVKFGFKDLKFDDRTLPHIIRLLDIVFNKPVRTLKYMIDHVKTWTDTLQQNLVTRNTLGIILNAHLIYYVSDLAFIGGIELESSLARIIGSCLIPGFVEIIVTYDDIWSSLLKLFGRICLMKYIINWQKPIEYAINYGPPHIKICGLELMYDLCKTQRMSMRPYMTWLFGIINSECEPFLLFRVIELLIDLLEVQPRFLLTYEETFMFLRIFLEVRETPAVTFYFLCQFENRLMLKYERPISMHFLQFILDINNCKEQLPGYYETLSERYELRKYLPEQKLLFYKIFFNKYSDNVCFHALNELFTAIIGPYADNRLNSQNIADVVYDCLTMVTIFGVRHLELHVMQHTLSDVFDEVIRKVRQMVIFPAFEDVSLTVSEDFNTSIGKILTCLLKLLFRLNNLNKPLVQDAFLAFSVFTKAFYGNVLEAAFEQRSALKPLLKRLPCFYAENKNAMHYLYEGINWNQWKYEF